MKRTLLLIAGLCVSHPALAQQARVQSGEHDTFSRLVVYVPDPVTWRIENKPGQAEVIFEPWDRNFDLTEVFNFIPRERIRDMRSTENRLIIDLTCDCEIQADRINGNYVVFDVQDGGPIIEAATQPQPTTPLLPLVLERPPAVTLDSAWQRDNRVQEEVNNFQTRLSNTLRRAVQDNLAQPVVTELAPNGDQIEITLTPPQQAEVTGGSDRVVVTTPIGRRRADTTQDIAPAAVRCYPERFGELNRWGNVDQDFSNQISALRTQLYTEFDELSPQAGMRIARLYIYFAMGAESLVALKSLGFTSTEALFLRDLAEFIEGRKQFMESPRLLAEDCEGAMAVWSALTEAADENLSPELARNASRAFTDLPSDVQRAIASRLLAVLQKHQEDIAASVVENALNLRLRDPSGEELKAYQPLENLSASDLQNIVKNNNSRTPEALREKLNRQLDNGLEALPEDEALLDGFIVQLRHDPSHGRLLETKARIMGAQQKFFEAAQLAETHADKINPAAVWPELVSGVLTNGSDATVSAMAMRLTRNSALKNLPPRQVEELMSRLVEIGLPELSLRLAEANKTTQTDLRTLAFAQVAAGQFEAASATAEQLNDAVANEIREQSLSRMPRDEAQRLYQQLKASGWNSSNAAWSMADWPAVDNEGLQGDIASSIVTGLSISGPQDGLEYAEDAIRQSESARSMIEELVEQAGAPEAGL